MNPMVYRAYFRAFLILTYSTRLRENMNGTWSEGKIERAAKEMADERMERLTLSEVQARVEELQGYPHWKTWKMLNKHLFVLYGNGDPEKSPGTYW